MKKFILIKIRIYIKNNIVLLFFYVIINVMKTIILTGASGGIGNEIAKTLAKNNNKLILIYNTHKPDTKNFKNCEVQLFQCDLTNESEIKTTVDKIKKKNQEVDVLINCAGISKFQQIQDTTEQDYIKVFDTNLKSTILLTAAISKLMISQQKGNILNISSMWGVVGSSMESLYSASKAAMNNLTLSLAKELGPSNINVNSICPGLIDTKMNKNLSQETIQDIIESTPLNRIGKPKDVANLVEFLISDKANFITGQIITIDGGFTL